jgi:tetratricopeptide (TPR) repeat protein
MTRPPPGAVALVCVAALGCGGAASGYRAGVAEGDRAYRSGRFAEAAAAYERAAANATARRDVDDARYRAAMACRRGGDRDCARRNLAAVGGGGGQWDHGPRARLELAALGLEGASAAELAEGHAALERLIRGAPETGPARAALRRELRARDLADPTLGSSIAWLAGLAELPTVRGTALLESVLAERAARVEVGGTPAEAEAAWRAVVGSAPYPQNSRWDDGHLALARVQRAAGRPRDAVATLRRMLAVREASWGNGSYAAPRFDDGAMLEAEILRDDLRDDAAAADAYHRVYAEHLTSLRRDDALWEEALLRARTDRAAACRVWATLVAEFPCQRFAERARRSLGACGVAVPRGAGCRGG